MLHQQVASLPCMNIDAEHWLEKRWWCTMNIGYKCTHIACLTQWLKEIFESLSACSILTLIPFIIWESLRPQTTHAHERWSGKPSKHSWQVTSHSRIWGMTNQISLLSNFAIIKWFMWFDHMKANGVQHVSCTQSSDWGCYYDRKI